MIGAYHALLLVSFGGPEGPDDVMPFLENVTRGRGIPRERLDAVAHHYLALGGVSPINAQNRALLAALRDELAAREIELPLYWGNRNWHPYLAETVSELHADGHRRILALATSAFASYSSCRQYREDLAAAIPAIGFEDTVEIDKIRLYFDHPGFLGPFAEGVESALAELAADGVDPASIRVLFTTHSIPEVMAAASGPPGRFGVGGAYVAQHRAAMEAVVELLRARGVRAPPWSLAYQSRSGSPDVPWLGPDVNDALRLGHAEGMTAAVIVPIGFVSDHVEVIWDLDTEARQTCDGLGVRMTRVTTPGTHPLFVSGLVDLVVERATGGRAAALSPLGPWPGICARECCANARGPLPAVAGEG